MKNPNNDFVNNLLIKAGNDFESAKVLLNHGKPITDTACFHCQQVVEKCFKAYLAYHDKSYDRAHELFSLQNDCSSIDKDFASIDLKDLNNFAVTVRYAEEFIIPTLDEAKEYLGIAKQVKELVRRKSKWILIKIMR